ncbi:MAG: extracellular solute-binding protein [Candidatus Paceibacterota bacterium]
MSNFQIGLIIIFILSLVLGLGLFATQKSGLGEGSASLLIWGTIPEDTFNNVYKASSIAKNKKVAVTYVRKDSADFDDKFIEALADGVGPDIVILRQDSIYTHRNKIFVVPYENFSQRNFKDIFIEDGEIFLTTKGITAFPFIIDPMVMYWNRDMFSNNLISSPPKYWDEFYGLIDKVTRKDSSGNIMQSALSLGEWKNVTNAKSIFSLLLLQAGTPIVSYTDSAGYKSVLSSQLNYTIAPGQSALNFYTQFSNPTSVYYTWNRSLPSSLNFFLSSNLATYVGFASELFSIQQKNPNLNFDVTYVPQIRTAKNMSNFANIYGLSIVKQSKAIGAAFLLVTSLVEPDALKVLESKTNLPPVRRDLLADKPTDAYRSVFYDSALISKSWVDPSPVNTTEIFKTMVESVTSGQQRVSEAILKASDSIDSLFKK